MSFAIQNQPMFERMYPMQDLSLPVHVVQQVPTPQEPVYKTKQYRWFTIFSTFNAIFWILSFVECYALASVAVEARKQMPVLNVLINLAYGVFLAPFAHIVLSTWALKCLSNWGYAKSADFANMRRSSIAAIIFCSFSVAALIVTIAASGTAKDLTVAVLLLLLIPIISAISFIPSVVNLIFVWKMLISTKSDPKRQAATASAIYAVLALVIAIFSIFHGSSRV